jgi:hypothetical protein
MYVLVNKRKFLYYTSSVIHGIDLPILDVKDQSLRPGTIYNLEVNIDTYKGGVSLSKPAKAPYLKGVGADHLQ